MNNYKLLCKFVDQSKSFTYGFEAGKIWTALSENKNLGNVDNWLCVHTENVEQFKLFAETLDYEFIYWDSGVEGWTYCYFIKNTHTKPTLQVVK